MLIADAFKYAAAQLEYTTSWALDSIGGSCCEAGHDDELDALHDAIREVRNLAARLPDPLHYSDGRVVRTHTWIVQDELSTEHIWHPEISEEKATSYRGDLPSGDPDLPSPGLYEVATNPEDQSVHVRVVRTA